MTRQLHLAIEIFTLILSGTERDKKHAANLIRKLDAVARRDLRAACQRLDRLVEDAWMGELREKRIARRNSE
jgi:hypothetical protein